MLLFGDTYLHLLFYPKYLVDSPDCKHFEGKDYVVVPSAWLTV